MLMLISAVKNLESDALYNNHSTRIEPPRTSDLEALRAAILGIV